MDDVEELSDVMSGMSISSQPISKYVRQPTSVTMAKCVPSPPYRWTKANKAFGIPKGYCEKDIMWKPVDQVKEQEDEKSFPPPSASPKKTDHDLDLTRKAILGPKVYELCKTKQASEYHLEERAYWLEKKIGTACSVEDIVNLCELRSATKECGDKASDLELKKFNDILEHQTECAICFDDLGTTFQTAGPCGHLFHEECLKQLERSGSNKCPSCRGALLPLKITVEKGNWPNGKPMYYQTYRNGVQHGLWKRWYDNGQLQDEDLFKEGKLVKSLSYHENGKLEQSIAYNNKGEKDGESVEYHPNGKVAVTVTFVNGKKQGQEIRYYDNGKKSETCVYKDNFKEGPEVIYYTDGTVFMTSSFKEGAYFGERLKYHKNGKLAEKWLYNEYGLEDGISEKYDKTGNLTMRTNYFFGEVDGLEQQFDKNGEVKKSVVKKNSCEQFFKNFDRKSEEERTRELENTISENNLSCIAYYVLKLNKTLYNEAFLQKAAKNNYLELLKFLCDHSGVLTVELTVTAAQAGHLRILKYLHEKGCPWNYGTTTAAAAYGNLDCLRYAHENGCPWDFRATNYAAANGHFECLKYAVENGCETHNDALRLAIRNGSLTSLEYMKVLFKKIEEYLKSKGFSEHNQRR